LENNATSTKTSGAYVPPGKRNVSKRIKSIFLKTVKYSNRVNSFSFISFYNTVDAQCIINACEEKNIRIYSAILTANWRKPKTS
jgi:hypothetical protein